MNRNLDDKELSDFLNGVKKRKNNKDNNSTPTYSPGPLIVKPLNYIYKQKVARQKAIKVKEKAKHNKVFKAELEIKHAKKELQHQYQLHHQLDSMPKSTYQPQTKAKSNLIKNNSKIISNKKSNNKPVLSKQDKAKIAKIDQDIKAIDVKNQVVNNQDTNNLLHQIGFGNVIKHNSQNPLKKKYNLSEHKSLIVHKIKNNNNNRPNSNNPFKHPFNNGRGLSA